MKLLFLVILMMFLFYISLAYSAPAPDFLALNHETKECGVYWPGDERIYNELPSGWKSYSVVKNYYQRSSYADFFVETEVGVCNFTYDYEAIDYKGEFERCCNQFGYTYVSTNISGRGEITGKPLTGGTGEVLIVYLLIGGLFLLIIAVPVIIATFIYFIIRRKEKRKH